MAPLIPPDLILVSLTPSNGSPNSGSLCLHDAINPKPNHAILTLKQCGDIHQHCLASINTNANKAGLVISSDSNKTVLNIWSWQNPSPISKLILPSPLTCLALSPQGSHLACGTDQGLLLFYHLPTGQILSSFSAHYRRINCLRFTKDGKGLISASQDSRISVWSCASLVNHNDNQSGGEVVINPYTTFNDHSLPITDLVCEETCELIRGRVWTCSLDGTVKLWSLSTRSLISTFVFPTPISSIVIDPLGRFFFASSSSSKKSSLESNESTSSQSGGGGGKAYRVDLFRKKISGGTHGRRIGWERVGGGGIGGVERWKDDEDGEGNQGEGEGDEDEGGINGRGRVIHTRNPITSMLLLPSTTHLLLGTSNGTLILSDVKTCQILKTTSLIPTGNHSSSNSSSTTNINSNSKSKKSSIDQQFNTITNIQLISKPYDLHSTQSNSNLNLNIDGLNSSVETSLNSANSLGCNIISQPIRPLPLNLDRVEKINGNGNGNLLGEILPIRIEEFKEMNGFLISDQEKRLEILRNELRFSGNLDANDVEKKEMVGNANANANGSTSEKEKKDHLKEIENLRKQLNEAKSLNEEMWKKLVDQQEGEQVQDESMNLEDQDEGTRNPSNPASSSKKGKEKNKKGKKRRVGE